MKCFVVWCALSALEFFSTTTAFSTTPLVQDIALSRRRAWSSTHVSSFNSGRYNHIVLKSTTESVEDKEDIILTPDVIAEMIEVTFVQACLQLAKGYVDVLKLFIAATKSSFELGIPSEMMIEKVNNVKGQSAGRPLMDEEKGLRSTWIDLVYLTLHTVHDQTNNERVGFSVDKKVTERFGDLVRGTVEAKSEQLDEGTEDLQMDDIMNMYGTTVTDPMERALFVQGAKVVLLTLKVMEEEKLANDEDGSIMPPKPPIPGTQ